jgi:diguanylate cyclase (GGDEF)-like protein
MPSVTKLLRATAERLRAAVREVDTVARVGGDEFVVVLTALGGASDAERLAEKLVEGIREPMRVLGMPHRVQRQRWRCAFRRRRADIGRADAARRSLAMYAAKEAGRNCYRMFTA